MKKYILLLLTLIVASSGMAKIKTHAMIITLKDGTRDTIMLYNPNAMSLRGIEDAGDDDYVMLDVSLVDKSDVKFNVNYSLTEYGKKYADFSKGYYYGAVIDEKPRSLYTYKDYIYFAPADKKYENNSTIVGETGKTYYAHAWCFVDDKIYFSKEQTITMPKLCALVLQGKNHKVVGDNYFVFDFSSFIEANKNLFGERTNTATKQVLADVLISMSGEKEIALLKQSADSIDVCDDGEIVYVKIGGKFADQLKENIVSLGNTPFYVKADLTTILPEAKSTSECGYYSTTPVVQACDEKWGVRDNCYLTTPPALTSSKPQVALNMTHVMLPGKKYNLRLIMAPNTEDETSEKTLSFYIYLLDGNGKNMSPDTYPQISGTTTALNKMRYNNGEVFVVGKDGAAIDLEYTPKAFTFSHALLLQHSVSTFSTSANRNKYEQSFRIVGVEVTPAE